MLDGRYRDKKYLAKYDLSVELFEAFGLKVTDVVPIRNVFVLSTDKGDKIFKRIEYSIDELNFISSALEYIKGKFPRVLDFVKTKDEKIYIPWNRDVYCMMDLVDGKECDFNNPVDLTISAKGIGELHSASEGFRYINSYKNTCGKTIDSFKRRLQEMEFFKNIANLHEYKTPFDEVFLKNADYHVEYMKRSIELLEKSPYYKLCSEEDKVVLCHHDLAYHNILINNEEAYFIDFDYAVIDLKVHDLCNFINKVIKNFAFDIEKANSILRDYCSTNRLDKREIEVLNALLTFPEDFYSISRDYYTKRKDWEEEVFFDRLTRKTSYKEEREEFLEEFKKLIN